MSTFQDGQYVCLRRGPKCVGYIKEKANSGYYQVIFKNDWKTWRIINGRSIKKITEEFYNRGK